MGDVLREPFDERRLAHSEALTFEPVSSSEHPVNTCSKMASWRTTPSFDGGNVRSRASDACGQLVLRPASLIPQHAQVLPELRTRRFLGV